MLPKFVAEEELVRLELQRELVSAKRQALGFMNEIPKRHHEEGDKHGSVDRNDSSPYKEYSVHFQLSKEDLKKISRKELIEKWREVGRTMAQQQSDMMFKVIEDDGEKNRYIVKGPKNENEIELVESIFEAMERIDHVFDDDRNPTAKFYASTPEKAAAIYEAQESMLSDPTLRKRYLEIRARKYEQYRSQQADRRLVD